MGLTQEAFATALGVERSTVARWERGVATPQPWSQPNVARILKISVDVLDQLLAEAPSAVNDTADRLDHVLHRPSTLDLITVAHLRQQVQLLDEHYDRAPSTALLADAGHALGQITYLTGHAPQGRARRELREVEAESATLMGQLVWDASQRRDHHSARTYYGRAVDAAREVGDVAAEGHALLRTSYICLYGEHDPQSGLALTQQVAATTATVSPVLTGLALLHSAEAHAMLGETRCCETALGAAQSQFATITTRDPATHLFSDTQFNRLAGSCYLFLGDHARAQRILEKSARTTPRPNKSRAIVLGNLSLAHLRQGQLDAATAALHEAIDIVDTTRGGGGMNIVFHAGRELRDWRTEPAVHHVHDRLLSLMTTA